MRIVLRQTMQPHCPLPVGIQLGLRGRAASSDFDQIEEFFDALVGLALQKRSILEIIALSCIGDRPHRVW